MPKVPTELKERLKADGRWGMFLQRREALGLSGRTPVEAQEEALAEFFGDSPPEVKEPEKLVCSGRASFVEQAKWVAQNMDNCTPDRSSCPDPAAWSMLMACHETPSFKTSFWTNIYTKVMLMQMKAEESREDAEADQGICDLCKVLEEADEGV